jgi:hypothetical protein
VTQKILAAHEKTEHRPILVTGIHRSGTTWIGKTLAFDQSVTYISEPLNVLHRPGVMRLPTKHWYTYICANNDECYLDAFQETLGFKYHLWRELRSIRTIKDGFRMVRDASSFFTGQLFNKRPLIKDPFAIFSSDWFANKLGCQVVITIRHPAALVSSLKRLGWGFDFSDFLDQPLLVSDWLKQFENEIRLICEKPNDILAQGCLLWCIIYQTVLILRTRNPGFILVRHEDISRDPLNLFEEIYSALGLNFTTEVQRKIQRSTRQQNPNEVSIEKVHSIWLDSQANLENWKHRLTVEEIHRVKELTASVYPSYYGEQDW